MLFKLWGPRKALKNNIYRKDCTKFTYYFCLISVIRKNVRVVLTYERVEERGKQIYNVKNIKVKLLRGNDKCGPQQNARLSLEVGWEKTNYLTNFSRIEKVNSIQNKCKKKSADRSF